MRQFRTVLPGIVAAGLLAAGTLAGCGDDTGSVSAATGGTVHTGTVTVRFGPHAVSRDTKVRIRAVKTPAPPGARWVAAPVDVTLADGALTGTAELTLPVTDIGLATSADMLTELVTQETDGTWTGEGGVVDRQAKTVTSTVSHFSVKGALSRATPVIQVGQIVKAAATAYRDLTFEAKQPQCTPASEVWTARAQGGSAVKVCVSAGNAGAPSVLRVVNNRVYPQFLRLRGYPLHPVNQRASSQLEDNVWRGLADADADYTFLPGKGELDLALPGNYRQLDFIAQPGVEAVISQLVMDVLSIAYLPVSLGVSVLQCALGSRVVQEVHGPQDLDPARLTALGAALASCVSGAVTGYKFTKSGDPTQADKDRQYRSTVVNAVSKAVSDLPTIGETVLLGAIQGPSGQHVVADRSPLVPTTALDENRPMPQAVVDTQKRLYDAAAGYPGTRQTLDGLVPGPGLMFADAADPGQPPSLVLGQEPDPLAGPRAAAALAALMVTPPVHGTCGDVGRAGYVYGSADPSDAGYPARLKKLGWSDEAIGLIRSAGDAARGYRVCLLEDGTWASFSHDQAGTTFAAATAGRLADVTAPPDSGSCKLPPDNPFVPYYIDCVTVLTLNLDGDGQPDRLLVYQRDAHWYARAVLGRGRVTNAVVLQHDDDDGNAAPVVVVANHLDLDAVPGDEVALQVGYGAHSTIVRLLSVANLDLTVVARSPAPNSFPAADAFIIDSSQAGGSGLGCADANHDGKPELVEGDYYPDHTIDGTLLGTQTSQQSYAWQGKTLVPLGDAVTRELPPGAEGTVRSAPFNGITCTWR